jgi:formate hydrogenlyase transcriptional activator
MPPARVGVRGVHGPSDEARVQSLFNVIDLIGRHTHVGEFLPHLAGSLRTLVDFDLLSVVIPHDAWTTAQLYTVCVESCEPGSQAEVQSIGVAPLDRARLAAAIPGGPQPIVLDRLDQGGEYEEVIAALRGLGQQSACLLPLLTALGPVGLIGFGSSREGTYCQCDMSFLRHIGVLVAVVIDNVRHHQEAVARERQLQADRDHWRTLLEVTNAVVTQRDVAALRGAIAPNVRRIVPHDHTNLYLIDEQRRLGPFVVDPTALAWPKELPTEIRPDAEPYKSWLAPFDRAVDVDVTHADPTGWEALHARRGVRREADLQRRCDIHRARDPLARPPDADAVHERRVDRVTRIAEQITIALENALAFAEIGALKDRLARENVYLEEEIATPSISERSSAKAGR